MDIDIEEFKYPNNGYSYRISRNSLNFTIIFFKFLLKVVVVQRLINRLGHPFRGEQ